MISVIVPTHNNGQYILSVLNSLLSQVNAPEYEIIVVDDGSTDNTRSQVDQIESDYLKIIRFDEQRGVPNVRNAGIAQAKGDILAFTLGDALVPENYLYQIQQQIEQKNADGIVGPVFINLPESSDLFIRYLNRPRSPAKMINQPLPPEYVAFGNCAVKRNSLEQTGGFDTDFQGYGGHELEFAHRLIEENKAQIFYSDTIATHRQTYRTFPETREKFYQFGNHNLPILLSKLPQYRRLYHVEKLERAPILTSLVIKRVDGFLKFMLPVNSENELGGWLRIKPNFVQHKFIKTALGAALLRGYLDHRDQL